MITRPLVPLFVAACALSGCTIDTEPLSTISDPARQVGAKLTESQKAYFVSAVLNTPTTKLEAELPKKLSALGAFTYSFNMYEIASTAYELVLERPTDMSRWRAVAKLDSFDTGADAPGYQAARTAALRRNPNLFNNCPSFAQWSAQYHQELRGGG